MVNRLINRFNLTGENLDILSNIGWLFFDKVINKGLAYLIIIWIAREIGAEQFGLWNYAIAIVTMFSILSTLGLNTIVVREMVKYPEKENQLLGTTFLLKFVGGVLTMFLSILLGIVWHPEDLLLKTVLALTGFTFVIKAFDVIEYYFLSQVRSRYVVMVRTLAFVITAVINIWLILHQFTLVAFVIVHVLEIALGSIFMIFVFWRNKHSLSKWKIDLTTGRQLLRDGSPLILAGVAVLIYMRVDQIMIGNYLDNDSVGIYSAAVRLSEMWMLIPFVITRSTFPKIVKARDNNTKAYFRSLQYLFNIMAPIAIVVGISVTFLDEQIIWIIYGEEFIEASGVLVIHIWAAAFSFIGYVAGLWFTAENLQKFILYRTISGAAVNVILNLIFIPRYGIIGAAVATLLSQFTATYFFNLCTKKTLIIFKMQSFSIINTLTLGFFSNNLVKFVTEQNFRK